MSQTRSGPRPPLTPQQQKEQAYLVAAALTALAIFLITPPVVAAIGAIGLATLLALYYGAVERSHVIAATLAGAALLALDWTGATAAMTSTRDDFRAMFGAGSFEPHWTWLAAAIPFGWPLGMLSGFGMSLIWRQQDKRSGKRSGVPPVRWTRWD